MNHPIPTFQDYESAAIKEGYDEVAERVWPGGAVAADHRHPFAVRALVVQGEMWLSSASGTRHLRPGDAFRLEADALHAERYGAEGATYWAARRHGVEGGAG